MNRTRKRRRSNHKTMFTKRRISLWDNSRKPLRSFSETIDITDEFREKSKLSI